MLVPGYGLPMGIGTSIFLIALGAILTFAVDATVSGLDLDGRNSRNLPSPTVSADDTVWREHATILAGTLHMGMGDRFDPTRTRPLRGAWRPPEGG